MTYAEIIKLVYQGERVTFNANRSVPQVTARFICFYLARKFTMLTYEEIANPFGVTHANAILGIRRLKVLASKEPRLKEKIVKYENEIRTRMKAVSRPYQVGLLFRYRKIRLSPK